MSQTHTESALIVLGRKVRLRNLPYFSKRSANDTLAPSMTAC